MYLRIVNNKSKKKESSKLKSLFLTPFICLYWYMQYFRPNIAYYNIQNLSINEMINVD